MSDFSDFLLALEFDTDDPEFARGFEAGRLWEIFRRNDEHMLDGQFFHASNSELVLRMIDAWGRQGVTAEFTEDPVWMVLRWNEKDAPAS